jgi:hypothetical protein
MSLRADVNLDVVADQAMRSAVADRVDVNQCVVRDSMAKDPLIDLVLLSQGGQYQCRPTNAERSRRHRR